MRWSQLKSLLVELFDPTLALDIHCTVHRREIGEPIGRYWITLDKRTIWEVPSRVHELLKTTVSEPVASEITGVLRAYLDLSPETLVPWHDEDPWHLGQVLRAADRRVGKRRFVKYAHLFTAPAAQEILAARNMV